MKYAIIDIGSNSVRLMLWADGKTLFKRVITTRLGAGLAQSGVLSQAAMERSVSAVVQLCGEAASWWKGEAFKTRAFATAAVRRAQNGGDFVALMRARTGLETDVVSGEEEAKLAVYGALGVSDGAVLDIGGASTELCVREGGKIVVSRSLDIGAVRLYDLCKDDKDKLLAGIGEKIAPLPPCGQPLTAVGGTATTLAAVQLGLEQYDPARIQDLRLMLTDVEALTERLLSLSAAERASLKGMDPARADIIAGGALLLLEIMKKLSRAEIFISDRDNLEGYLILRGLL